MSAAEDVTLSRVEVEHARLSDAARALEGVQASAPELASAAAAVLGNALKTRDDGLNRLAGQTRKHDVTDARLTELARQAKATDRVVAEVYALAAGALIRQQGLDDGACAEADSLIAELADLVDHRLARPTIPGDGESLHSAADVILRRLPDYGIWDLPVMAHEFGHVLAAHLRLWDPLNDQMLEVRDHQVLDGWPDCSPRQGEELFCDLLACYAMGPCYGGALLIHRLDPVAGSSPPATHPPDAMRAAAVIDALELQVHDEPHDSRYRMTCDKLSDTWRELRRLAPEESRLVPEQQKSVRRQVKVVLDFLSRKEELLGYAWSAPVIRGLCKTLQNGESPGDKPHYRIRDILNAAWLLRLDASADHPLPPAVQARARDLIKREISQEAGDVQARPDP